MNNSDVNNNIEKSVCKKSYLRVTEYERNKIKQYCLKHHIPKSRLVVEATLYCIENNVSVEELLDIK